MPESNIANFEKEKLARTPHLTGDALCVGCNHTWKHTAPIGTTEFTCPECKTERGMFTYMALPQQGEPIFHCNCGGIAFAMRQDGALCMRCGVTHEWGTF